MFPLLLVLTLEITGRLIPFSRNALLILFLIARGLRLEVERSGVSRTSCLSFLEVAVDVVFRGGLVVVAVFQLLSFGGCWLAIAA